MTQLSVGEVSWERMVRAVERVRERLLLASAILDRAGIAYAVAGGNAVADKDRMHLRDLIDVGLVDEGWLGGLEPDLAARLQQLLADPEG